MRYEHISSVHEQPQKTFSNDKINEDMWISDSDSDLLVKLRSQ